MWKAYQVIWPQNPRHQAEPPIGVRFGRVRLKTIALAALPARYTALSK